MLTKYFWTICAIVIVASQPCYSEPLQLTDSGAILYYNTPAAVADGAITYAGWIEKSGAVVVAKIEGRRVHKKEIHKFDLGDDHAAPALAIMHGQLFAATAYHSTDLFIYRLDKDSIDPTLICRLDGRFTYPRWISGNSELLIRQELGTAGHLAKLSITPTGCSEPEIVIRSNPGEYIYATSPAVIDAETWVAYSIYSLTTKRHEGVFANNISTGLTIKIKERMIDGAELLAWSIAKDRVQYTTFSGAFECCNKGVMWLTDANMQGRTTAEHPHTSMPYYPSFSEATCGLGGLPYMSQRFGHGFIASEISEPKHNARSFESRIFLCTD